MSNIRVMSPRRQSGAKAPWASRRRHAGLIAALLAIMLSLAAILAGLGEASAAPEKGSLKAAGYWKNNGTGIAAVRSANGTIMFCVEPEKPDPIHRTFSSWNYTGEATVRYDRHSAAYLAYVLGSPEENKLGLKNYAPSCTVAFWALCAKSGNYVNFDSGAYHVGAWTGNIYSGRGQRSTKADGKKIKKAVNDAKAHKGKAGVWDRASKVWYMSGNYQDMIEIPSTGSIRVSKASKNAGLTAGNSAYKLSGAKFGIYTDAKCTVQFAELVTDINGVATRSGIPVGMYYVKEKTAPTNYKIDSTKAVTVKVTKGGTVKAGFSDTPLTANIQITKGTTDPSIPTTGRYSLAGAVYGIWEGRYSITNGPDGKAETADDILWGTKSDLSGVYEMSSANGYGFVIDAKGNGKTDGTVVEIYGTNGSEAQRWRIEKATGQGANSYWISNASSGLRIAPTGNPAKSVALVLKTPNDKDAKQAWDFTATSGAYVIKNHANASFVIDIPNANMTNGNQLKLWTANGTKAQSWRLRKTLIGKATTDDKGVATFKNLVPNTSYYIREISAPTGGGYEMNYKVITLKTGASGSTVKGATSDNPTTLPPTVSIGTTATANGEKVIVRPASGDITIKDVVSYTFTIPKGASLPKTKFTLTGTLMDKSTKKAFQVGGKSVTGTATFTPSSAKGTCEMTFTIPASSITKTTNLVVYEELKGRMTGADTEDKVVATHKNINDVGQTVTINKPSSPSLKIGTTATINGKKSSVITTETESITIKDVVSYAFTVPTGATLPTGEFTVTGTLMDKSTKATLQANGQPVTSTATFTPSGAKGTCEMEFTFPASALTKDTSLVVYEKVSGSLNAGDQPSVVATHENINDAGQTVKLSFTDKPNINIRTVATVDGKHEARIERHGRVTIVDKVHYDFELNDNTLPQRTFRVSGVLMDKSTGEEIKDADGNTVTGEASFTPNSETGDVDVKFEDIPGELVAGKHVVVFERVYDSIAEGLDAVAEDDLNNQDQTVSFPEIGTTATDDATGGHEATVRDASASVTINDEVAYKGLIPGQAYTVTGTLMDKATGEALPGVSPVTVPLTPSASNGTVLVEFVVPGSALSGKTVVAFESLSHDGTEVAVHADINDEGQSVAYRRPDEPVIRTTAHDSASGTSLGTAEADTVTIIDEVAYEKLLAGKGYRIEGTLMDKETGKPLGTGDDGSQTVTASGRLTPSSANGITSLEFTVASKDVRGRSVVVFERLYEEGGTEPVATHENINDAGQTVTYAGIRTTATDDKSGGHYGSANDGTVTINDVVRYAGLTVDKEYKVVGTLMDKGSEDALMREDAPITSSATFTPKEHAGEVTVKFDVPTELVKGKTLVVFETLYDGEQEVATHADIDDDGQTVSYPEIHTTATDAETKDHYGTAVETVSIDDVVAYKGLIPGKTYLVTGTLMDKETGKPIAGEDGKPLTASSELTPNSDSGEVTVSFSVPGSLVAGKSVVAFESVSIDDKEIAVHADINDENQTVRYPGIHTTAYYKENGGKDAPARDGTLVIVDKVEYTGLTPNQSYVMRGSLHDKAAELSSAEEERLYEVAKIDFLTDEEGNAFAEFTPSEPNGTVELEFNVPAAKAQARDVVAFERLYEVTESEGEKEEVLVALHEDINDEGQTVHGPVPETKAESDKVSRSLRSTSGNKPDLVATGDRDVIVAAMAATAAGAVTTAWVLGKRGRNER